MYYVCIYVNLNTTVVLLFYNNLLSKFTNINTHMNVEDMSKYGHMLTIKEIFIITKMLLWFFNNAINVLKFL